MSSLRGFIQEMAYYYIGFGVIGVVITGVQEQVFMWLLLLGVIHMVVVYGEGLNGG